MFVILNGIPFDALMYNPTPFDDNIDNPLGFLDNPNSVICSSVFAENETNMETAKFQLKAIKDLVAKHA